MSSVWGTSARTRVRSSPTLSVPSSRPRRVDRSDITPPTRSSGTTTATASYGSSKVTDEEVAASRSASAPAIWKAMSEESTACAFPSVSVTRRSTTG